MSTSEEPDGGGEPGGATDAAPTRRLAIGTGMVLGGGALLGLTACSSDAGTSSTPTGAPAAGGTSTVAAAESPSPGASVTTSAQAGPQARPSVASVRGPDITRGPSGREEVSLTFHGQGPAGLTDAVVTACREASALVTVFAVGTWVAADPGPARALQRAGHELGNHTWSHPQMPQLGLADARAEVRRGRDELASALGAAGWWFRPSGTRRSTATIRAAARAAGYARCVSYDVDPEDYLDPGATVVRTRVRRAVRAGSIVSLHLGHAGTAEALPGILTDLSSIGLAPVTLSRLLRD